MITSVDDDQRELTAGGGSVTAVFLFSKKPSPKLREALDALEDAQGWALVENVIDVKKSQAFRVVRVPAMILYNSSGIETARTIGEENIVSMLGKLVSYD